jgi:hypothetical protein
LALFNTLFDSSTKEIFRFPLTGAVPSTFRIGFMVDVHAPPSLTPDLFELQVGADVTSQVRTLAEDGVGDVYLFDVSGAAAGQDLIVRLSDAGAVGDPGVTAVFFDSLPVPEPSTLVLGGIGAIGLLAAAGRRRRAV